MIEYLKRLVRNEAWTEALLYAEDLARTPEVGIDDLVVIYRSILKARIKLGEHSGALVAGDVAIRLAKESGDWDSYGIACNDIGVAHFLLKQYDQAASFFSEFLMHVDRYDQALEIHMLVWYNLGCVYRTLRKGTEAVAALTESLNLALQSGDAESIQGIRLVLVDVRLKAGYLEQLPRLFAQSSRYLRTIPGNHARLLFLLSYRIEYALLTGRPRRARMLAAKGLLGSADNSQFQCVFHLLLARIEKAYGAEGVALEHALAARTHSLICQRPDLEVETTAMIERFLELEGT